MQDERDEQQAPVKVVDRRRYRLDEQGELVERENVAPRERPVKTPPPAPAPAPEAGLITDPAGSPMTAGPAPAEAPSPAQPAPPQTPAGEADAGAARAPAMSEEDQRYASELFLEFLNSLAHSMLVQLGEVPDPGSGIVRENLEAARQTLEMLSVLRHKTEGNLSAQEARMFDSLLYELMMRFRQRVEKVPAGGPGVAGGPGGHGPIGGGRA